MIKTLKELQEAWKIKRGDIIYFDNMKYTVSRNHLSNGSSDLNDFIFTHLWIEDKYKFCSDWYWYKANFWSFPICKVDDCEALYRVAVSLYELIENKDYSEIDIF